MPYDGPDGFRVACNAWARGWKPREPIRVSEWAQRHRRLSGKTAAEPGPWRNERIPFLAGIMDALADDHPAQIVGFIKSSQLGGSEAGLNWIGWTVDESPAPMLVLFPTEKLGERWSRGRLQVMIAETPSLRAAIPSGRKHDNGNSLSEKDFPDGRLYVGSANIPSDLSSTPIQRLLLDEVDRFPYEIEGEGDPVELAIRRTATWATRRKVFLISTPTIESLSRINRLWQSSTQHRYFVSCVHCHEFQSLKWDNLRWPEGEPLLARYVCEHCGAEMHEHHKTELLAGGEWRAAFPERDVWCFHANALYTPIGLGDTWGQNAAVYEDSRRDPAKLKVFINTRLGETHKDPREILEWEALYERREPYQLRTIPRGVLMLNAGVDVQRDRFAVMMVGWARNESAWVIDYLEYPGDPTRDEIWDWLDDYLAAPIANSFGVPMRVTSCAIDSGYLQHEVTNFTRTRKSRNIFATKGMSQANRQIIGKPTLVDVNYRGRQWRYGAEQYAIGVSTCKATLYERLRADVKALPMDRHVHFSDGLPQEFYRQLTAEVFDPNKNRGWVKLYERNEALDTFVLNMAAAMHQSAQVHRLRELDWLRLEEMYEPKDAEARKERAAVTLPGGGFMPTAAVVKKGRTDE